MWDNPILLVISEAQRLAGTGSPPWNPWHGLAHFAGAIFRDGIGRWAKPLAGFAEPTNNEISTLFDVIRTTTSSIRLRASSANASASRRDAGFVALLVVILPEARHVFLHRQTQPGSLMVPRAEALN